MTLLAELPSALCRAREALGSADIKSALGFFSAAARIDSKSVEAHHGRAECLRLIGRPAEAKAAVLKCLSHAPVHVEALTLLAELVFEGGDEKGLHRVVQTLRVLKQGGIAEAGPALQDLRQRCRAETMQRTPWGAFEALVSLGNNCEPALQMVRHGYDEGNFFRYTLSSIEEVCRLIVTDFAGVYQRENLVPYRDGLVLDVLSGLSFHSDLRSQINPETGERQFCSDYDFTAIYRREWDKVNYLIEKWRRLTASDARVLYIRKHDDSDPTRPEKAPADGRARAQELHDVLAAKYPRHDFLLLFLQTSSEREADWAMPRMINRYFTRFAPLTAAQEGVHSEWDQVFADFPLLPEWLRVGAD